MAVKKKWKWGEINPADGRRQYPLHKAQSDVLNSTARFTFAFAGTGGGKTVLIALRLAKQIQKDLNNATINNRDLLIDPLKYLIVVPTYGMLKKTGLLEQIQAVFTGTAFEGTYRPGEHIYPVGGGKYGSIFIASAENPKAIEGGQYDALYLDEAAKIGYEAWRNAKARVGHKNGPVFGVTTPDVNNWIFTEIFKNCDKTNLLPVTGDSANFFTKIGYDLSQYNVERSSSDGDYYCRQWSSAQNGSYPVSVIENAFKTLNRGEFERRYLGSFSKIDGLVYETFAEQVLPAAVEPTADEFRIHPAVRICGSIDFGFDPDPAAILVGVECQDNRVYIPEEVYLNRLSYDELAKHCHRLMEKWGITVFYCDSSGKAAIHELNIRGVPATKRTIPDIQIGCQMVNARLRTDLLRIYGTCPHLIDEMGRYARPTDADGDLKSKPIDKHNHACDALRYLITGMDYGRPLASYRATDIETPEQKKEKILEREIFLGRVNPDPAARRRLEEEAAIKAKEDWFQRMVLQDSD